MPFDDDDEEDPNSFPKCSDDEARVRLYPAQKDVASIPSFPMHYFLGSPWTIGVDSEDGGLNRNFSEAIQDILRFALPDWIMDCLPCPEPHLQSLPAQSKAIIEWIGLHYDRLSWPRFSNEDGFSASELPSGLLLHRALSLSGITRFQCATEHAKGAFLTPSLIWTPAYDMIFEYIERDVLWNVGVAASFRPRWSVYPNQVVAQSDEWPVVIPDVVFSVQIPGSEASRSAFAKRAHEYHPAHSFDGSPLLDVPLLLVEYNKCWAATRKVGIAPHLNHLRVGMIAASTLYDALRIQTPVFGLFVGTVYPLSLYAGVMENGEPSIRKVPIAKYYRSGFDVSNSIQMMHLYAVLGNLQTLSAKVSSHVRGLLDGNEVDLSPLAYEWPTTVPPTTGRRHYIDRAHPPLIVDDALLQFLFVSSPPRIADWLRRGRMTLGARPAMIEDVPSHVREWLRLLSRTAPVSFAVVQDAVEDSKKGMPRRIHALVDTFWFAHSSDIVRCGAPDYAGDDKKTPLRYVSDNLLHSLSACARALDLLHRPLNRGHTLTNDWLTLYRTLFTEASRCCVDLRLRYNHAWAVHSCLRLADTLSLDEIRPDMAFLMPVKSICRRCEEEWDEGCKDHARRVFSDLCVCTDAEASGLDRLPVDMPIFVVEFVLDPNEREKHVAHLAICMRSALAVWEMHGLADSAAVLGFLLDRNMDSVFVGWMDQNECIIQELSDPDFTFDISKPSDAYSLFALLRLQGSRALYKYVNAEIDVHVGEAVEAAFREDYHSWKEPKRTLSSVFNLKKPVKGRRNIESWLAGVETS